MLELINVEDLYENDKIIIMDSIFFNNNKLIENIEIGFKNKSGDIIDIKTIKLYVHHQSCNKPVYRHVVTSQYY